MIAYRDKVYVGDIYAIDKALGKDCGSLFCVPSDDVAGVETKWKVTMEELPNDCKRQ